MVLCKPSNTYSQKSNTFLIFESALLLLFTICRYCLSFTTDVSTTVQGTFLKVSQFCKTCCHHFVWESQPMFGTIPAGNILLSSAILFTGLMPTKALRMLNVINCVTINRKTFFRHQKSILQPFASCLGQTATFHFFRLEIIKATYNTFWRW